MPALILFLGVLLGGYALYRFLLNATIKEIVAMVLTVGALIIGSAMFFLAITGRLPAALGIMAALMPLVITWVQARKKAKTANDSASSSTNTNPNAGMTPSEALDILGLQAGASAEEIVEAHRKLMKQFHPDQDGSEGLAKKINQAKDLLIKE